MKGIAIAVLTSILFAGCASVKMESKDAPDKLKQFAPPTPGNAGIYRFRDSSFGAALKKDIFVDGKCVGESAPKVFFYTELAGGKEHEITTESEVSPNAALKLMVQAGKNYFIRQYIKLLGVLIGGANLEVVPEDQGKAAVAKLELAARGQVQRATVAIHTSAQHSGQVGGWELTCGTLRRPRYVAPVAHATTVTARLLGPNSGSRSSAMGGILNQDRNFPVQSEFNVPLVTLPRYLGCFYLRGAHQHQPDSRLVPDAPKAGVVRLRDADPTSVLMAELPTHLRRPTG
ncbi:MAG: DUF2846 domain-containing protein [Betaproteobacteria bacterium]